MDGRVLDEAFGHGPDPDGIDVETAVHTVQHGDYRAAVQVSWVAGRRYVDASWRITAG